MSFSQAPRKGVRRNTPLALQQSRNSSPTTSSRSPSMNIPRSFIPPRDTTRVTQRAASMSAPKPALEQTGQPAIDMNRSPTRRSRTPTGCKPGSGPWQARPSYADMVSTQRNSSSSMPTVVPTTTEKMTERLVAPTSKKDQLKSLGLGTKPTISRPSTGPTPTSLPIEAAQPQALALAPPPPMGGFAKELERYLSPIAGKGSMSTIRPFLLDKEEEQEVATSISVFKYGRGQECNASTRESSRDRLASTSRKGSPAHSTDEAYDFIDKIIESHEKLRADMSSQTALFNETLVHQLSSTLAENMERQMTQLNATLGHHLSHIDKVLTKQGDSFIALMKYLKDTRRRSSRSRDSSEASECARGHSPAQEAAEQDNV